MEKISSDKVSEPFGIFSQAIRSGNIIFVSGQVARDRDGNIVGKNIKEQTRQTLKNLSNILKKADCTLDDVVKITVFTTDIEKLTEIHEVRSEFFEKDYPASSLVEVNNLVSPDLLIEIEAIAVKES